MEGSGIVSDEPGRQVFVDFESSADEYAIADYNFGFSAEFFSKQPSLTNKLADKAIMFALFRKRLKESILMPDVEIILETDDTIFLKDMDNGNISITNSAEMVCCIYS